MDTSKGHNFDIYMYRRIILLPYIERDSLDLYIS